MDPPVKAGPLLLQQPPGLRIGAKRWKRSWFVLYPASRHGVARLEFFDCKEGAAGAERLSTRRPDKKVVRLADCVSVAPAPDCSPKDGLAAFRLETSERAFLFAAEPRETAEWVAQLCKAAFLQCSPSREAQEGEQALEMATNSIYCSREEASAFRVTAQKTEAAQRCGLQGTYVLKASGDRLVLGDPHSQQPLYTWPYRLLRRYGRDKVMFSFEAGRRCESGPGNFTFETRQGNEIFRVVEAAIRAQKAQVQEDRQSSGSLDLEAAGLAQVQSAIASTLSLEREGPAGPERRGHRAALPAPLGLTKEEEAARPPAPADMGSVYSEPLDAVKSSVPRPDPLYADPVDSRRAGAAWEEAGGWQRSAGWGREQVGPPAAGACQEPQGGSVHIYDEPEGRAPQPSPLPAAIYDEARLPCEAWWAPGPDSRAGGNPPCPPGAGDCAAPPTPQKPPRPCPAPKPPRMPKAAPLRPGPREEPLYSQVLKPPSIPAGQEESVDESCPASVYEDLGEI
ncbi:hypothetical protein lerEdw1_019931 [Lerista edwardsae]|nr:hypothetical protein lerEdw1_019931 [Lerista edwardsae]